MRKLNLHYAPMMLPLIIFWITGVIGLDYGHHWDEPKLLEAVRASVYNGTYLPTFYNYPSVSYTLGVVSALPEIVGNIDRNHLNEVVFHGHIAAYQLDNDAVLLRTRLVFLVVSSLAIVWVYVAMWRWTASVGVALFSSSVLAFSWEVAYHARWIAPDAILMQFGALFVLCIVQAYRNPAHRSWLWGAVVVAGLATGTKYPAGLLVLPALVLVWWRKQSLMQAVFVFGLTYLITTPGTLLNPFKFWYDVEYEMWHYSFGHSKQTVTAGIPHLLKNLNYLSTVQLSHMGIIALVLFGLAMLGLVTLWRESRKLALLVALFPLSYVLFMSLQRAMIIRNLLVVAPFVAVLAGLGVRWVWHAVDRLWWRVAVGGVLVVMLSVNAGWLMYAAGTIQARHDDTYLQDIRGWATQHPTMRYFATSAVLRDLGVDVPQNISDDLSQADEVLVYLSEIQELDAMPANTPRVYLWWFGSWEVNVAYYTWQGDDKVMLLPAEMIRRLDLVID
jgi:4-amino-4-deoxy-L-arabinose transferase-like glycosyltransferase